jgi:protein ImuB
MKQKELYACVYLCLYLREFPVQAVLRLRPELGESTCVVMEGERPLERVCSLTTKARLLGLRSGMNRTEVESFPHVKVLRRSARMEQAAREVLLECAGTYSPRVEEVCGESDGVSCSDAGRLNYSSACSSFLCVMDVAGTEKLFGSPELLARKVLAHVRSLGMQARVVVSGNFHAAVCVARAASVVKGGTGRRSIEVIAEGEEARALATLPVDVLPVTDAQREVFGLWGIETLGQMAALPRAELIARMGQDGRRLQAMARGERAHLFVPRETPMRLEERQELEFPLESLDSLMFGVAVMLEQLIVRAKARLVSLAEVRVALELEGGLVHARRVRPAQATNEKQFWVRLLHLELGAHPPEAAVVAVTVEAEPGDRSKVQMGLFSPPLPEAGRLDVTLAQLRAMVGDGNVGAAVLEDTHAAEGFRVEAFCVPGDVSRDASAGGELRIEEVPERAAVRRVRPAERVAVRMERGRPAELWFRGQRVVVEHAYGPWIAGGEWWSYRLWNVEEWDLVGRVAGGGMMCCSVTRDLCENTWKMTGLYD